MIFLEWQMVNSIFKLQHTATLFLDEKNVLLFLLYLFTLTRSNHKATPTTHTTQKRQQTFMTISFKHFIFIKSILFFVHNHFHNSTTKQTWLGGELL